MPRTTYDRSGVTSAYDALASGGGGAGGGGLFDDPEIAAALRRRLLDRLKGGAAGGGRATRPKDEGYAARANAANMAMGSRGSISGGTSSRVARAEQEARIAQARDVVMAQRAREQRAPLLQHNNIAMYGLQVDPVAMNAYQRAVYLPKGSALDTSLDDQFRVRGQADRQAQFDADLAGSRERARREGA